MEHVVAHHISTGSRNGFSVSQLLRRCQQLHNLVWAENFGGELTSPQFAVLVALARWPGVDQRELGSIVSLDKSSITDIVARLERRMWISRDRDPGDSRRYNVRLAPAASIALAHLNPSARRVQNALLDPVAEHLRIGLIAALRQVSRITEEEVVGLGELTAPFGFTLRLDAPGHLIRRALQVQASLWKDEFEGELTSTQFAVLGVVLRTPGIYQALLSAQAELDKSTTTGVIERLVQRGWLDKQTDPTDRRSYLITATSEVSELMSGFIPRAREVEERLLSPLSLDERTVLLSGLDQMARARD